MTAMVRSYSMRVGPTTAICPAARRQSVASDDHAAFLHCFILVFTPMMTRTPCSAGFFGAHKPGQPFLFAGLMRLNRRAPWLNSGCFIRKCHLRGRNPVLSGHLLPASSAAHVQPPVFPRGKVPILAAIERQTGRRKVCLCVLKYASGFPAIRVPQRLSVAGIPWRRAAPEPPVPSGVVWIPAPCA